MDTADLGQPSAIDRTTRISHSPRWSLEGRVANSQPRRTPLFRSVKRAIERLLGLSITRRREIINPAFASFTSDPALQTLRLAALTREVRAFLAALGLDHGEDFAAAAVTEYDATFRRFPVKNLNGGLGYNNGLFLFAFTRAAKPATVIESGVWRGFTTYLLEAAAGPDAALHCFDIDFSNQVWKSDRARYVEDDVTTVSFEGATRTLAFFDDHYSHFDRLLYAERYGFEFMVFDDDLTALSIHADAWPPAPTLNMVWNHDELPEQFSWIYSGARGTANLAGAQIPGIKARYHYVTPPDIFAITGYPNSSPTSYLVRRRPT